MIGLVLPTALMAALTVSSMVKEPGVRLTTETAEYCRSLAARVAALPNAGEEPTRSIAAEGIRLCHTGYVRTGVAKLRRALRAAQAPQAGEHRAVIAGP
jgi:hypothetical protein